MKKIKILLIGVLCALLVSSVAVGCSNKDKSKGATHTQVVLADFEKWSPDFQTLRLRNEFGSIEVNKDAARVKSGSGSAALTVVGSSGSEKPYFFVNTVSNLFGYDYSDFSKVDSISVWFYSASETDESLHVGLITKIVSIEQDELQKYETFTLKPGWNEIVYKPDMNYVISAVGVDKYTGIEGIYFMFDNPHAASKADGKKFFVDDVVLHYGAEKPFTEVRAGTYYSHGSQIGPSEGLVLDTPVPMENLQNKALAFDFRFESDEGRFGFAIMCLDGEWWNVTGTLVIEKKADGTVKANMGRITVQNDGWYTWTHNSEFFSGDGAAKAKDISLIYHQGETVLGNVIIDWKSMRAVDAYELSREERASRYVTDMKINGNFNGQPTIFEPVDLAELDGKAVYFEFKFVSDTGKFGFVMLDDPSWKNVTNTLIIEKKANDAIEANMGRIVVLEDGWYAWKLNSELFAGDGLADATNIGVIYDQGEKVQGEVLIDWDSLQAVDAYALTKEERSKKYADGEKVGGNNGMAIGPVSMASLEGKALHLEFKFVSDTGKFGFALMDGEREWANITDTVTVTKNANGIIVNKGKIVPLNEGWYAWELNRAVFAGGEVQNAQNVSLVYHQGITVTGEVWIDWKSLAAVEPQTYFSSNSKIAWSFSSGNGITSQIPSENGTHNALKITNDNTHSQAQWMYFVLQLDPQTIEKLDNAKELALKLKLQRNTAASNVAFNFRISPAKWNNNKWETDNQNWAKNATDNSGVDGYSDNVALDTWHTIRFLRQTCWGSDTIAALKANGGKIVINVELKNNNPEENLTENDFAANTDFGFNLIIDDMTVTQYKYLLDFENASDESLLTARSYDSTKVSTCELSGERAKSGSKAVKVYQNQLGALMIKVSDELKTAMNSATALTVSYIVTNIETDDSASKTSASMGFWAAGKPNDGTDQGDNWRNGRIDDTTLNNNMEAINAWHSITISGDLYDSIKQNGYIWIECSSGNQWDRITYYVDFITLE